MDTKLEHIASSPSLAMAQPAQDLRFFAMSTGQGTQRLTPAGRGESAQTIFEALEEQTWCQKPPAYLKVHAASYHFLGNGKIRRFGCSLLFSGVASVTHVGYRRL